jgi:Ca2+-transporting ATPase
MTAEEVSKTLDVDPNRGLSFDEVARRLEKHGLNELKKDRPVSPFTIFLNQFRNILVVILLAAIGLSALMGEGMDAAIIGIIVLFVTILGFIQEYRAERALESLKKMLSPSIAVVREGREMEVLSKHLVPGDILRLQAGDRVPADARIIEAHALKSDESSFTGESLSVDKESGVLAERLPVADRKNMVFCGTTITYGRGKAAVVSTGMETEFGRIAGEMMAVKSEKTPLERRTAEIGRWLSVTALVVCVSVVAVSSVKELFHGGLGFPFIVTILMFGVSLAVAAVPEALPAIVTGTLAIGMRRMAKENALVRKMPAVETLGCTTVICTDKTGTLTRGEMTVRKVFLSKGESGVSGIGYEPSGSVETVYDDETLMEFLTASVLCNDSDLFEDEGAWRIKGDSTEAALLVLAAKTGMNLIETRLRSPREGEIPFSSERKRMTTIHRSEGRGRGYSVYMKGAPEIVLSKCSFVMENGMPIPLTEEARKRILLANDEMASSALRVLALAARVITQENHREEDAVETQMVFLGLAGMMDPPRPEAVRAIETCRKVSIKPVMITGDHRLTAVAVARELGIHRQGDLVLTGAELEKMTDEEFETVVERVTVYARVSPLDKLKIIKAWKKRGEVVAMTGDGVNDAPALKHADIGVAMGITGTEVTKEAADIVLLDDNFATIVKAVERGRWIYDNIKKYLTYLLRCNITEVLVIGGIVLLLGPDYLPLLPAAILYINLATDGLPAIALGIAPPDPDIMERPPRRPGESVFSADVLLLVLLAILVETPFFYALFLSGRSDITHARTLVFFAFIIIELFIALSFRSMRYGVFRAPPHGLLIAAIAWETLLMAGLVRVPTLRDSFGIVLPSWNDLGLILGFAAGVFIIIEIEKWVLRLLRRERRGGR